MGNSRNISQKSSGSRRPQTADNSTSRKRSPQKNIETMRVLSNIIIPSANTHDNQVHSWITNSVNGQQQNAAHPIASTSQYPAYFTEMYQNAWQQGESCNGQETSQGEVALSVDIVNQALAEVINEGSHLNQNVGKEGIVDIMQQMSPWSDGDFIEPEKWTTTSSVNNKDKGPRSTKKSRRSTDKEGPSKKQKIKESEKPEVPSSELKHLLLEETSAIPTRSKKEQVQSNTSVAITSISNPIIIADDGEQEAYLDPEINIFSQETDMVVFRQAITLKKKLVKEKDATDSELTKTQQDANWLEEEITRLNEQLTATRNRLNEISHRRDGLAKKINWVTKSLG